MERPPILKILVDAGYIPISIMLVKEFVGNYKAFMKHIWAMGNLCNQEDNNMLVGPLFVEMNLVSILFEAKEMIGD